jgi:hypothetical protein
VESFVLTLPVRLAIVQMRRSSHAGATTRIEKLDLRLTPDGKRARADEALADRRTFRLSATQWKAFMAALDATPRPLPRLQRLLREPGFFDAGPNQ